MTVENIGKDPTYESSGNKTRIDVTLSQSLKCDIVDWKVDRVYNASDHNTITFKLGKEKIVLPKTWK